MRLFLKWTVLLMVTAGLAAGCVSGIPTPEGTEPEYVDPGTKGPAAGTGMESQDIVGMADAMMRDMMANPTLASQSNPPTVIIDEKYFTNESDQRINKQLVTDRLRINLNRAANGRMRFVARHAIAMVEHERELKREGKVTGGKRYAEKTLGADYRLTGRITSNTAIKATTGMASRFFQVIFEMVDLETGELIWSNYYEFKKAGQDDVIYR